MNAVVSHKPHLAARVLVGGWRVLRSAFMLARINGLAHPKFYLRTAMAFTTIPSSANFTDAECRWHVQPKSVTNHRMKLGMESVPVN